MKINKYDLIIGALILLDFVMCIYIGLGPGDNPYLCGENSGCGNVQNSIYSTLFGIKLAWFGAFCFAIFFVLFLIARVNRNMYWMFFSASVIGAGFALYFMYLQAFVLKEFCRECMIIDGIMVILLITVIFEFVDFRKEIKELEIKAERAVGIGKN